jgi:hypothetical protein
MWWETGEFFAEVPFREVLGIVVLVDSDDCVAGNTCLSFNDALMRTGTNFRPKWAGAKATCRIVALESSNRARSVHSGHFQSSKKGTYRGDSLARLLRFGLLNTRQGLGRIGDVPRLPTSQPHCKKRQTRRTGASWAIQLALRAHDSVSSSRLKTLILWSEEHVAKRVP